LKPELEKICLWKNCSGTKAKFNSKDFDKVLELSNFTVTEKKYPIITLFQDILYTRFSFDIDLVKQFDRNYSRYDFEEIFVESIKDGVFLIQKGKKVFYLIACRDEGEDGKERLQREIKELEEELAKKKKILSEL